MRVFSTGASSGIGAAVAKRFDAMGAELGLVGRSQEKLDAVMADMHHADRHTAYALDVTDRKALFEAARDFDAKGPVDIVVANAGISVGVKTEYEEDLDVLEKVYRTNVFAMAATFHPFIEPMSKRGGGQFVGIGSVAGIRGLPGSEAYCSSKAAVISYLESLRNDVRKYGISVTTICPGFVRTPLTAKNPYRMPFILEPEEFADRAVKAMLDKDTYRVIPWQMAWVARLLKILPNALFDRVLSGRGEKPRARELGM